MSSKNSPQDQIDAPLCARCRALPAKLLSPGPYVHTLLRPREPFSLMRDSALQGCQFCALLLDAITGERNGADLTHQGQDITLRSICKSRADTDYHALCTETGHSKAIAVWHSDMQICHLRFELETLTDVNPDASAALIVKSEPRREVQERADDPSNFAMINKWLDECTKKHNNCKANLVTGFTLPARLIDVWPEEGGVDVKLVTVSNQQQQLRPGYTVLSHCWGPDSQGMLKTTALNLKEMQKGIDWNALPKTFQDAIAITRQLRIRGNRLRYIWIDALCILQGNKEDFEREGTAMHKIYSMATCTIAASASADGHGGCTVPRSGPGSSSSRRLEPCKMKIGDHSVVFYPWSAEWQNAHRGPLSSRGWCFQERELSRRILHFTSRRIVWECRTAIASEDHPAWIPLQTAHFDKRPDGADPDRLMVLLDLSIAGFYPLTHSRPVTTKLWCKAVQEYTHRHLSCSEDRLAAIYGMANVISGLIRDQYVAGIWLVDFARGASWVRDRSFANTDVELGSPWPPRLAHPAMPSWSWAAIDGPVRYPHLKSFHAGGYNDADGAPVNLHQLAGGQMDIKYEKGLLSNFVLEVELIEGEEGAFGSWRNSQILVRGVGMDITLSEDDCTTKFPSVSSVPKSNFMFGKPLFRSRSASQPGASDGLVRFDFDPYKLMKQPLVCLRLGERKVENSKDVFDRVYVGLVLQPVKLVGDERSLAERLEMDLRLAPEGWSINRHAGMFFRRVGTFEVSNSNKKYKKGAKLRKYILV